MLGVVLVLAACSGGDAGDAEPSSGRARAARAGENVTAAAAAGTATESIYSEGGKLIRAGENIGVLGNDLFGDRISFYDGSTQFIHGDASLPGNSVLPVSVGRRFTPARTRGNYGHFADWDLEIPRLHGVFSASLGWAVGFGVSSASAARCTQFGAPPQAVGSSNSGDFDAEEYWHGSFLYVPGSGSQEILFANTSPAAVNPSGALADSAVTPTRLTTKDRWTIVCGTPMQYGGGEGFTAVSPDGVRYRFDWMVTRPYSALSKPAGSGPMVRQDAGATDAQERVRAPARPGTYLLSRVEVWILPTLVTDRFGNTVRYTYDAANPWRLLKIESNVEAGDSPRRLTFEYGADTGYQVSRVSDGTRVWRYGYSADGGSLTSVTLPDNSAWTINLGAVAFPNQAPVPAGTCSSGPDNGWGGLVVGGDMVHPSGARGTFRFSWVRHGRSYVDRACTGNSPVEDNGFAYYPQYFDSFALKSKTISGPGLPFADLTSTLPGGLTWQFDYEAANGSWSTCSGCPDTKTVLVTDPELARTRYTFGTRFRVTDGQLLKTEEGWNGSAALRTTVRTYAAPTDGPYPDSIGSSAQPRVEGDLSMRHAPERLRTIGQQSATFEWRANAFDRLARATDVTRSSSLGFSRRERTDRADLVGPLAGAFIEAWVLGQTKSVFKLGAGGAQLEEIEGHEYDGASLLRTSTRAFGLVTASFSHYADGTLKTRADGLGQATSFAGYKRGLAQNVTYADGRSESAAVDDHGQVTAVTNAAATTTYYQYDAAGRLNRISYPAGDPVPYHPTVTAYEQSWVAEYGLEPGHWRQTVTTGHAVTQRFFDAQWRPRLTRSWDSRYEGDTRRVVVTRYDSDGRKVFESYPQRADASVGDALPGTSSAYDALGRVVQVSQTGGGTTSTAYLEGFQKQITNPRQFVTTHSFQAFDEPREDTLAYISAPEGVTVAIQRDAFGKALSITRSGGGKSVTRSYVYDGWQRLCKTIEPETGATVQYLDAANNVLWRASGLSLTNGNACDHAAVPPERKVSFSYDARHRLLNTTYGDGTPQITRTYTPDGMPETVGNNGLNWTYRYNNRRVLTSEQYWFNGTGPDQGWGFHWAIDDHGHVMGLSDMMGTVLYSPDAFGRPRQVSGYASNVVHHPNGMVASYTLANGVTHSVSLNARQLPELWLDEGPSGVVQKDRYSYDPNGNITGIADELDGAYSRSMPWYDGLDRLRQANGIWGTGRFDYDALDNLVYSQVGGRTLNHNINGSTNRLDSLSGSQNVAIGYDANGNVTQRGGQTFWFDVGNRLWRADGKANYSYDAHGRRNWTGWLDGSSQLFAYSQSGKLLWDWHSARSDTRHVYLGDKLIAETNRVTGTSFVSTDALGSPVARTNAAGAVVSRTRYEPYGGTAAGVNPVGIGFTGHVNDVDTGLVYMQQRYYDPIAGRFLSVDPVTTDEHTGGHFGRYHYAENNPYKFVDPDGRAPKATGGSGPTPNHPDRVLGNAQAVGNALTTILRTQGAFKAPAQPSSTAKTQTDGGAGKPVPDSTVVCRGGSCTSQAFTNGKGVTVDPATGKLDGVSTGLGDSVASASKNIPHPKVGVTTAGDIRAAGGEVVNDKGNHGTVSGLTADKAAEVFKKVVDNPNTTK